MMKTHDSILPEETLQMIVSYGKVNPELMGAFSVLHQAGAKPGALSAKLKELIAPGISINTRCEDCITMLLQDALKQGASRTEIVETTGNAIYMGGGPSSGYGASAAAVSEEFEEKYVEKLIQNH